MKKKVFGLLILLAIYLAAIGIGVGLFFLLKDHLHIFLTVLIIDVACTVFVWATGLLCKTASVYDPYWSVQTFFFYLGLLIYFRNWNIYTIIPLVAIFLYSVRLTVNFILGFHDLSYIDWRYKMLREKSGRFYQFVNLFGICMFPTLIVYAASLPLIKFSYAMMDSFSVWPFIGSAIILGGTILELITDLQMKKFIKTRTSRSEVINVGLWKYSRHPNYLGEILIWFGVFLVYPVWYLPGGAIANLLMFLFISIPMEERHMLEYKPGMVEYKKTTSMLLILPRRKPKE